MNERIKELAEQATRNVESVNSYHSLVFDREKFAELIIADCCQAVHPMLRDQISRGQAVDLIRQHFGVEE